MSAKLKKAWRFWRNGCIPVDYPAGSVLEDENEIRIAKLCGVLEEEEPAPSSEEESKKKAKKRKE